MKIIDFRTITPGNSLRRVQGLAGRRRTSLRKTLDTKMKPRKRGERYTTGEKSLSEPMNSIMDPQGQERIAKSGEKLARIQSR